jgi:hypothetical protein
MAKLEELAGPNERKLVKWREAKGFKWKNRALVEAESAFPTVC